MIQHVRERVFCPLPHAVAEALGLRGKSPGVWLDRPAFLSVFQPGYSAAHVRQLERSSARVAFVVSAWGGDPGAPTPLQLVVSRTPHIVHLARLPHAHAVLPVSERAAVAVDPSSLLSDDPCAGPAVGGQCPHPGARTSTFWYGAPDSEPRCAACANTYDV